SVSATGNLDAGCRSRHVQHSSRPCRSSQSPPLRTMKCCLQRFVFASAGDRSQRSYTAMMAPQQTPVYPRHRWAEAHMVDFAGYWMPLQYSSIREEHLAVRERAGIFDLSHMGEIRVSGTGAAERLDELLTNPVADL